MLVSLFSHNNAIDSIIVLSIAFKEKTVKIIVIYENLQQTLRGLRLGTETERQRPIHQWKERQLESSVGEPKNKSSDRRC